MRRTFPIWVLPSMLLAIGFVCGVGASRIQIADGSLLSRVTYSGEADSAKSLLSTVIGGVVSITTLTLTITIVTIQLASSQYSPRLMKRYVHDRKIQVTASYFFFVFAVTIPVLFHVRAGEVESTRYIPGAAISIVIVLAVLMLLGLVFFVFHVTSYVRVENILDDIAQTTGRALEVGPAFATSDELPEVPDNARAILSAASGFVTRIDTDQLEQDVGANGRLWLEAGVGEYVIEGAPLAWYQGTNELEGVALLTHACVQLESERDEQYEFAYGLRQIADIGVKALSPGINDPTTAIVSIDVAARVLSLAAVSSREESPENGGATSVSVPRVTWGQLVLSTFDQYATYGSGDVQVVRALLESMQRLIALAPSTHSDHRLSDTVDSIAMRLDDSTIPPAARAAFDDDLATCRALLEQRPAERQSSLRGTNRIV